MGRVPPGAEERGSPLPGSAPPPPAGQTLTKGKRRCVRAAVNQSRRKDTAGKQARLPAPARLRTGRCGGARSPRGRARGCFPVLRSHWAAAPCLGSSTEQAAAERLLSPPTVHGARLALVLGGPQGGEGQSLSPGFAPHSGVSAAKPPVDALRLPDANAFMQRPRRVNIKQALMRQSGPGRCWGWAASTFSGACRGG